MLGILGSLVAGNAWAAPPPPLATLRTDVDGDGVPEAIVLETDGALVVAGTLWGRLSATPPLRAAVLEVVPSDGVLWVHAKATGARGTAELVAVRGEVRFSGPTGSVGDGERALEIGLTDGLTRWWRAPTVQRCDGEGRLFRERWVSGHFVPARLAAPDGEAIPVGRATDPRARPVFHWTAASTDGTAEPERRADLLSAPRELSDGDPRTVWTGGPGDWVVARAEGGNQTVTAIKVRGTGRLTLLVGARRFRFALTADVPSLVRLPEPVATDCVALVAVDGARLAEAEVFTDLDGDGALPRLVADALGADPSRAEAAVRLLRADGPRGVLAAAESLATATAPGRRRLLQLVAEAGLAASAPALAGVLRTGNSDERALIRRGLAKLGAVGERAAMGVLDDQTQPEEARLDAAEILQSSKTLPEARLALERALPAAAPALRRAVQSALAKRVDAAWLDEMASRLDRGPADAIADVELLHAVGAQAARWPVPLARALLSVWAHLPADGFAVRLRWLRTAKEVAVALPALLPALAEATRSEDDILRAAAIEALAEMTAVPEAVALVAAAHTDPSPRVRRQALRDPGGDARRRALTTDAWPMVRRGAATVLATNCAEVGTVGALEAAVRSDRSDEVRAAALFSLSRCAPASPAIATLLLDERATVSLRERAASLLGRPHDAAAAQALAKALMAVLSEPTPDDRALYLVQGCLAALGRTGDRSQSSLDAVARALEEPTPPVRAAAIETLGRLCPKDAGVVLRRAAGDADASIRRAAMRALTACPAS